MMIITNQITMDLMQNSCVPVLEAVQNDRYSRELKVTLLSGGEPWEVPAEASAVIRYCKADGTGGEYDTLPDGTAAWRAEGNVLTAALAPQVLTAAGPVRLMVALIAEEKQISTFAVLVNVQAAVNETVTVSEDYQYVTRFLPGPAKAEAGEIFRVTSVDGQGRVTGVEAVELWDAINGGEPGEGDIPRVFLEGEIPEDKEDVLACLHYRSRTESFDAYVKIKCQGSSSMRYPKKNFTIKLYQEEARENKMKKSFRDWGQESQKYVLKANYIDHSHARNIVCARLWDQVVESREDYKDMPAEVRACPRHGAVDGFPVKLYANGVYQGLYTWNIPKDGWMLCMDEENPSHCILMGTNNSCNGRPTPTSCQFRAEYNNLDWETEFPDTISDALIASLNQVIGFVMTSTDEEFKAGFGDYVDLQSAIDYRIFADVIAHHDGLGNNLLIFTLDGVKWRFSAYDMDAAFGLWWDGKSFVSAQLKFPEEFQEPENLLFARLDAVFGEEIRERYQVLRSGPLSLHNMVTAFERFMENISGDLYEEDLEVYPEIPSGEVRHLVQIRDYIRERLGYCDAVMDGSYEDVLEAGLVHFFDGANADSTGWADSVDSSYQFTFTGEPTAENGVVQFHTSSWGILNKALETAGQDATIAVKLKVQTAEEYSESWALGTPNWNSGLILGQKQGKLCIDCGMGNAAEGNLGARTEGEPIEGSAADDPRSVVLAAENDGLFHVVTLKYVHAEQKTVCYLDGSKVGAYGNSDIANWGSGLLHLNNEGSAYRGDSQIAYIKVWARALEDGEIEMLRG